MKKITILALLCCPVFIKAQPGTYIVTGRISKLDGPAKVYLNKVINRELVVDSAEVHNGLFRFEGTLDGPMRAMLILDTHGGISDFVQLPANADTRLFYLEKGTIKVQAREHISKARITSPTNELEAGYDEALRSVNKSIDQITKSYNKTPASIKAQKDFQQKLNQRYAVAFEAKKLLLQKYIAENPNSYFSLLALEDVAGVQINPDQIEPLFQKLSAEVRNSAEGKSFAEEMNRIRSLAVGSDAPDFEVPDMNGKPVRLSDFKGKTVLLDFWASWCEPCRRQHQYVREAYKQFKDKNFTVISIALDPPADRSYLIQAIREDSLVWTNLADPATDKNQAAKAYSIKLLPQNYLIDSTGMIFNKDLHGESLQQQLNSLLLHKE
ncbi:redoxin domain-containing protein [Chitinophaga sp. 22321]|uniref:AhpC/TSA family protein n=1 Tax=Chitinophaga hostae TaxID=2831022 RepID=A0ABS5J6J8_9BACT|nr:TlpA disulfide reductase family protein [Chitinophaga hostae]MBS0030847.1 AhpC/TSA family protein [Chitinophaga hostae]